MVLEQVRRVTTSLGTLSARPGAFVVLGSYTVLWIIIQPETLDWHGFATLVTWAMTLFIQRAEHRDTQALQAKLDELLRVHTRARNDLTKLDQEEPEVIEEHRAHQQISE
ncbi:low affinity iron permease family protein [Chelativorans sp. J32]|mgnify:CR=1 FL=1|uniref:low affinity iron permease family protein n=1 Tax=Chelativorans sp. J32 TaxID=935840 RepID=UPI000487A2DC|nr:low affinity iron permease family protein [Chelativorans sp. J32]